MYQRARDRLEDKERCRQLSSRFTKERVIRDQLPYVRFIEVPQREPSNNKLASKEHVVVGRHRTLTHKTNTV